MLEQREHESANEDNKPFGSGPRCCVVPVKRGMLTGMIFKQTQAVQLRNTLFCCVVPVKRGMLYCTGMILQIEKLYGS